MVAIAIQSASSGIMSISELVQQVLETGYLDIETENQLRQLLQENYSEEDFQAFLGLQKAAMEGNVKQQARELDPYERSLVYRNALEPLVKEEVEYQIQKLSPKVLPYINPAEAIAYALNRLPALYATSEEGWKRQQQKAKEEFGDKITMAAVWGINAVMKDPLKRSTPLGSSE